MWNITSRLGLPHADRAVLAQFFRVLSFDAFDLSAKKIPETFFLAVETAVNTFCLTPEMLEHFLVVSGLVCTAFHSFKEESEVLG